VTEPEAVASEVPTDAPAVEAAIGNQVGETAVGSQVVEAAVGQPVREPSMERVPAFVYALGRVTPRFPSLGVEKEFAQATGRAETTDLTDREVVQAVLSSNRYLARQMCWVLTIEGMETYILVARDPADLDLLLEAVRPVPRATDIDVVIGVQGPIAAPETCNGLVLPVVIFDQLYSFDVDTLIKGIPKPDGITRQKFEPIAEELFSRVAQMADNAGATDEHRALNYLCVRYDAIYAKAAEMHARDFSLTAVEVRPSALSGVRNLVDVIFTFTSRQTGVTEQYSVRVDVSEEFPFLVNKLSTFYER
jgi:PatG C-terminal